MTTDTPIIDTPPEKKKRGTGRPKLDEQQLKRKYELKREMEERVRAERQKIKQRAEYKRTPRNKAVIHLMKPDEYLMLFIKNPEHRTGEGFHDFLKKAYPSGHHPNKSTILLWKSENYSKGGRGWDRIAHLYDIETMRLEQLPSLINPDVMLDTTITLIFRLTSAMLTGMLQRAEKGDITTEDLATCMNLAYQGLQIREDVKDRQILRIRTGIPTTSEGVIIDDDYSAEIQARDAEVVASNQRIVKTIDDIRHIAWGITGNPLEEESSEDVL